MPSEDEAAVQFGVPGHSPMVILGLCKGLAVRATRSNTQTGALIQHYCMISAHTERQPPVPQLNEPRTAHKHHLVTTLCIGVCAPIETSFFRSVCKFHL